MKFNCTNNDVYNICNFYIGYLLKRHTLKIYFPNMYEICAIIANDTLIASPICYEDIIAKAYQNILKLERA